MGLELLPMGENVSEITVELGSQLKRPEIQSRPANAATTGRHGCRQADPDASFQQLPAPHSDTLRRQNNSCSDASIGAIRAVTKV